MKENRSRATRPRSTQPASTVVTGEPPFEEPVPPALPLAPLELEVPAFTPPELPPEPLLDVLLDEPLLAPGKSLASKKSGAAPGPPLPLAVNEHAIATRPAPIASMTKRVRSRMKPLSA
jgi:hypothetical protein